jgi:hypothetical protein
MKIVVPSYKRSSICQTPHYLSRSIILVNKSEEEAYKKEFNNEILVMPDEKGGNMARVRNFVLDSFDDDIVMVDDDVKYFGFWENNRHYDMGEEEVYSFFKDNFRMARELGTVLWGVNLLEDKKAYREYSPFSLKSIVLGPCLGIAKENVIRFDEELGFKEDYDFSLQVLNKYRKILRFNKYHYLCKHIKMKGGCPSYRTRDIEREQARKFRNKWGGKIVKIKKNDINPVIIVPINGI